MYTLALSRSTSRHIGCTTECQSCQVQIAGGPSLNVTTSTTGPPDVRNSATAALIPAEHGSEEFGLMIRIRFMPPLLRRSRSPSRRLVSPFAFEA
jgi:hypothetical protein